MAEMVKKEPAEMAKRESGADGLSTERTRDTATFVPQFDIVETENELILYGDLPGVTPETLEIRFEDNRLTIHGRVEERQNGRELLYGEYGVGDFHREFEISEAIDSQKISAELSQGVLTLHLPKTEAVKPRRIQVQAK